MYRFILQSKAFLLFCITIFLSSSLNANNTTQKPRGTIEGYIKNIKGEVFPNATIYIENSNIGTSSDFNGYFRLKNVPAGKVELSASFLGYKTDKIEVNVESGETTIVEFELKELSYSMPQIQVIGSRDGIFDKTPGAASYIDAKRIQFTAPVSGNEVFRQMPGVHVVDEEGAGLRANIGIRGLDPSRSSTVLMLEDGVPVALTPYGEPEMYYTPSMDRMEGVEVLKGSGSILYGPQTIGGVINYITADPPEESTGKATFRFGQGGFYTGMLSYGTTLGNTGIQVNYLRKSANQLANVMYRINDLSFKLKSKISEKSTLGIKVGLYDEGSNSTYVGITQAMYDQGGDDFSFIAPDDILQVRRYSISANYEFKFNNNVKLNTTAFAYTTTRDWRRQDFSYDPEGVRRPTGVIWGDTTISGGAIYMDDRTGNRNRTFEVAGIEPRVSAKYNIGNIENELDAGGRFLYERAFEKRINGNKKDASSGVLRDEEIRTGFATSTYIQNQFKINKKFSVTAGVRTELFNYERDIFRGQFNIGGVSQIVDTSIVANSNVFTVIPGVGFNYRPHRMIGLFGGVHRGFAPPRVKDAITSDGEDVELDSENSWNFELGIRSAPVEGLKVEVTGFLMDFSNQIIPVAEAAGGAGAGLINGGRTRHAGVETGISLDFGRFIGSKYTYLIESNFTYVHARFSEDRFVGADETNINGNRTPYAPEFRVSTIAMVETPFGLGFQLASMFVSDQYTDVLNTFTPSNNGRIGYMPSYFILDGTIRYNIPKINVTASLSVKNILNQRYIVTRRPQGIRVGMPRFVSAGVEVNF